MFHGMTSLLNAWAWIATVSLVLLGTPLVFLVFCATAPFDRGRYVTGRLFRLLAVTAVKLRAHRAYESIRAALGEDAVPWQP